MSFYRISFASLNKLQDDLKNNKLLPELIKPKILNFVESLKSKGDVDKNEIITRAEYDIFEKEKGFDLAFYEKPIVYTLLNKYGEHLQTKEAKAQASMNPGTSFETHGLNALPPEYLAKYNTVIEYGLKLPLDGRWGDRKIFLAIDMAEERMKAIQESNKTGISIVVVYDSFTDPFVAHGNQIARRDVEAKGLISLKYDVALCNTTEVVDELIKLKRNGIKINAFSQSFSQPYPAKVSNLKTALKQDGIKIADMIKDDGSNIQDYKKEIRDWILNGISDTYEVFGLKREKMKELQVLDKLSEASISYVVSAGNVGPGYVNMYSFVLNAEITGALNDKGEKAEYSSETGLVNNRKIVAGEVSLIIEPETQTMLYDYESDNIVDEKFTISRTPYFGRGLEADTNTLLKTKLADEKAYEELAIQFQKLQKNPDSQLVQYNISELEKKYVFSVEQLKKKFPDPTIFKDTSFTKTYNEVLKSNSPYVYVPSIRDPNLLKSKPQIKVLDNKLQFVFKKKIAGTSFAVPQVAVDIATRKSQVA